MEGDLNLKPTAGVSSESGEKNSLVKSPGKTEPRLFVGLCPDHSGYRLCWCATCKAWLCRECIVADHPNDVCEVISLSQAVSMFQREDQGAMAQLKLRRIQTLSLVRKGDELKAAVQRLLKLHEELMDDLRKEQESLDAFTESSTKRTANLESISQYLNEDFEKTGDSLDIVAHTREDDVLQYCRTLEGWQQDQREWVDQLAKCLDATHNIKIKKVGTVFCLYIYIMISFDPELFILIPVADPFIYLSAPKVGPHGSYNPYNIAHDTHSEQAEREGW